MKKETSCRLARGASQSPLMMTSIHPLHVLDPMTKQLCRMNSLRKELLSVIEELLSEEGRY